jgi:hypothetical protein
MVRCLADQTPDSSRRSALPPRRDSRIRVDVRNSITLGHRGNEFPDHVVDDFEGVLNLPQAPVSVGGVV